ncbi:uncharacterized protein LOC143029989 [Oratosquilla oratoria]|uniref:uncharacterized protein LOC143029989 n=1 Tax=Oratosquilla oratoria TaxID=337810 RepID=UPI003F7610BD
MEDDAVEGSRIEGIYKRGLKEIVKDEERERESPEGGVLWRVTEEGRLAAVGRTEGGNRGDTRRLEVLLAWMDDHDRRLLLARVRNRDDEEGDGGGEDRWILSVFAFGPRGMSLMSRLGASEALTKCVWAADPTAALFCLRPNSHGLDLRAFNYRTGDMEASTELPKDWRGEALLLTGAAITSSSYVVLTPSGGQKDREVVPLHPRNASECQEVLVRGLRTSYTCHLRQERHPSKTINVSVSSREDQRPFHIYSSEAELPQPSPPAARLLILRSVTSCPPLGRPSTVQRKDKVRQGDPSGMKSRSPRNIKGMTNDQERGGARFLPSEELSDEGVRPLTRTRRTSDRRSYASEGGLNTNKLKKDLGPKWEGEGGGRGAEKARGRSLFAEAFEALGISLSQPPAASASLWGAAAESTSLSERRKPRGAVEERRAIALRQVLDKRPQMPPSPPSPIPPPSRAEQADQAETPKNPKGFHHQNSTRVPLPPPYNIPSLFTTAVTTAPTPKNGSGASGVSSQGDSAGGDRPTRPSHALNSIIFFSISLSIFATVGIIIFVRRCVRCPPAHHMTEQLEASLKPPSPPPDMFGVVPESGQGYSGATTSSSLLSSTMVASSDATTPVETPSSITALPPTPMSSHHLAPPPPPSPSSPSSLSPTTPFSHSHAHGYPPYAYQPSCTHARSHADDGPYPTQLVHPDRVENVTEAQCPTTPVANTQL